MARRKRLTLSPEASPGAAAEGANPNPGEALPPSGARAMGFAAPPVTAAPIARVAAETAATAALDEMSRAWAEAREGGQLIQRLPLDAIDEAWLVRDRMVLDDAEMDALVDSIAERGQQVPIEVVALEGGRYGLISGWRRLKALRILRDAAESSAFTAPRDAGAPRAAPNHVLAVLRRPSGVAEAYRAMIEENEIRAALSYYERAHVAVRASEAGAFADPRAAIDALFAAGSRARRSKIRSFLGLVQSLGARLRFPWAIPERLGLDLARRLEAEPDLAVRLRERLRKSAPDSAEAELALLTRALGGGHAGPGPAQADAPRSRAPAGSDRDSPPREEVAPGLWLRLEGRPDGRRLTLEGAGVDERLLERLRAWLRQD